MPARSLLPAKARRLATLLAAESFPSISQLSKSLSISRTTIREYRRRIRESGYSLTAFCALSPEKMQTIFRQQAIRKPDPERYITLTSILPEVCWRVSKGEANLRESWKEYRNRDPHGYGYGQFTVYARAWRQAHGFGTSYKWRITDVPNQDILELRRWRRSND
jgi:DNA-binding Lrp family transcriptional regulator